MEHEMQILGTRYFRNHINQMCQQAWYLIVLERQLDAGFRAWALESHWLCSVSSNKFFDLSKPEFSCPQKGNSRVVLE